MFSCQLTLFVPGSGVLRFVGCISTAGCPDITPWSPVKDSPCQTLQFLQRGHLIPFVLAGISRVHLSSMVHVSLYANCQFFRLSWLYSCSKKKKRSGHTVKIWEHTLFSHCRLPTGKGRDSPVPPQDEKGKDNNRSAVPVLASAKLFTFSSS